MSNSKAIALTSFALAAGIATSLLAQEATLDLKFAGAPEFWDAGTLFVGDNHNGAI